MENLIQFPKERIVRPPPEAAEILAELQALKAKRVFDAVAEESGLDFITTLSHLGMDIMDKEVQMKIFILVEFYKAILYSSEQIEHPFERALASLTATLERGAQQANGQFQSGAYYDTSDDVGPPGAAIPGEVQD